MSCGKPQTLSKNFKAMKFSFWRNRKAGRVPEGVCVGGGLYGVTAGSATSNTASLPAGQKGS